MFSIKRQIGASHIGYNGKLKYSTIIDFMQDCSGFQLDSLSELQEYFTAHGIGMYLVSRQIDIHRLPVYGETITIGTWIYHCKTIYGFRNTMIYGEDGALCVGSYASGAFVDLKNGKPVKMPVEIIANVPFQPPASMEYLSRKITIPDAKAVRFPSFSIQRYHLDNYLHVNNARYVDLAEEYLPEKLAVSRFCIDYRKPAVLGDQITPALYTQDNQYIIVLSGENGPYSVLAFYH